MDHNRRQSDPDAALLVVPLTLDRCGAGDGFVTPRRPGRDAHALVLCMEGKGDIRIGDIRISFTPGTCVFLRPGTQLPHESRDPSRPALSLLRFDIFRCGAEEPADALDDFLPYGQPIRGASLSKLTDLLDRLSANEANEADALDRFGRQLALQELIHTLLHAHRSEYAASDALAAVAGTIPYIERHYRDALSVEQLARLAGIGRWQYSPLFRKLTGRKPLDYVTDVRLKRARELLLLSDDPLRDIARSTGFKDEYYFNRRFRQMMGMSPKQFARSGGGALPGSEWPDADAAGAAAAGGFPPNPVRVVALGYALGEMLALGIRPLGGDMAVIGRQVVYRDMLRDVADVGPLGQIDSIRALAPDLIVHCTGLDESLPAVSVLAPTAVIDRDMPPFERFRRIAGLFGKRREAERWIASYERRASRLWRELHPVAAGATAAVFVIVGGRLFVMGAHGLAVTLYRPEAFRPAERIAGLIDGNEPFREVAEAEFPAYAGDLVFLLVAEDRESREAAARLRTGPLWREAAAAPGRRMHVTAAHWNFDDPITMDRLLSALPRLLRTGS